MPTLRTRQKSMDRRSRVFHSRSRSSQLVPSIQSVPQPSGRPLVTSDPLPVLSSIDDITGSRLVERQLLGSLGEGLVNGVGDAESLVDTVTTAVGQVGEVVGHGVADAESVVDIVTTAVGQVGEVVGNGAVDVGSVVGIVTTAVGQVGEVVGNVVTSVVPELVSDGVELVSGGLSDALQILGMPLTIESLTFDSVTIFPVPTMSPIQPSYTPPADPTPTDTPSTDPTPTDTPSTDPTPTDTPSTDPTPTDTPPTGSTPTDTPINTTPTFSPADSSSSEAPPHLPTQTSSEDADSSPILTPSPSGSRSSYTFASSTNTPNSPSVITSSSTYENTVLLETQSLTYGLTSSPFPTDPSLSLPFGDLHASSYNGNGDDEDEEPGKPGKDGTNGGNSGSGSGVGGVPGVPTGPPEPHHPSGAPGTPTLPTSGTLGVAFGTLVFVVVIGVTLLWWRKKQNKKGMNMLGRRLELGETPEAWERIEGGDYSASGFGRTEKRRGRNGEDEKSGDAGYESTRRDGARSRSLPIIKPILSWIRTRRSRTNVMESARYATTGTSRSQTRIPSSPSPLPSSSSSSLRSGSFLSDENDISIYMHDMDDDESLYSSRSPSPSPSPNAMSMSMGSRMSSAALIANTTDGPSRSLHPAGASQARRTGRRNSYESTTGSNETSETRSSFGFVRPVVTPAEGTLPSVFTATGHYSTGNGSATTLPYAASNTPNASNLGTLYGPRQDFFSARAWRRPQTAGPSLMEVVHSLSPPGGENP